MMTAAINGLPMTASHHSTMRRGHTLFELIAATASSAVLLAGLGSVMLIARQVAYAPAASEKRITAAQAASQFEDDARFALLITARSSRMLEFVVTDRDGDGDAEKIRYEWSGVAGAPLKKTVNGGTALNVIDSVQNFEC